MASTYSSNLKIELMSTGENAGTWGNITNTNLGTAYEQAVIGLGNPDYTSDANLTITLTDSNASQAARCLVLNVTSAFGSLTATRELIVPTIRSSTLFRTTRPVAKASRSKPLPVLVSLFPMAARLICMLTALTLSRCLTLLTSMAARSMVQLWELLQLLPVRLLR